MHATAREEEVAKARTGVEAEVGARKIAEEVLGAGEGARAEVGS